MKVQNPHPGTFPERYEKGVIAMHRKMVDKILVDLVTLCLFPLFYGAKL